MASRERSERWGLLLRDALGYRVPDPSLSQIFRMPDSIHRALVQSGSIPG